MFATGAFTLSSLEDTRKRHFVIYPLYLIPRIFVVDPTELLSSIELKNIEVNTIKPTWRGDTKLYSIVGDKESSGIVQGRFLRLNKDNRSKVDFKKLMESELGLGPNEYVEEEAFFLFDTHDKLLLGEYNPSSVNVLGQRVGQLLNHVLQKIKPPPPEVSVYPIPSDSFLRSAVGSALIRRERIEFPSLDLAHLEDVGVSSKVITELAEGENFGIVLTVKLNNLQRFIINE